MHCTLKRERNEDEAVGILATKGTIRNDKNERCEIENKTGMGRAEEMIKVTEGPRKNGGGRRQYAHRGAHRPSEGKKCGK